MMIITTKDQLKYAKQKKVPHFVVVGDLATKIQKAEKLSKLSKKAAIALATVAVASVAAIPLTGGTSLGAGAGAAALITTAGGATISTEVVIAALGVGGVLMAYGLYKEYNIKTKIGSNGIELEFNRK